MENSYKYSPNAVVFKKFFGDIHLTVVLELPKNIQKSDRKDAVNVLKDDICNLLNDTELEKLLNPKGN